MFDRCSVVEVRCVVECTVVYDEEDVLLSPQRLPSCWLPLIKSLICSTRGLCLASRNQNQRAASGADKSDCSIRHPAKPDLPTETPLTPAMTACLARSVPLYPSHLRRQTWTEQCCNGQPEASGRFHHLINAYTHPYN
jgi:hypothetical protein